LDPEKIYS